MQCYGVGSMSLFASRAENEVRASDGRTSPGEPRKPQTSFPANGRQGVRQVKAFKRIALSLGPIIGLLVIGIANWKVGGGPTLGLPG
jgi:hypothetical protein